jgi:hypothetical protein
MLGLEHLVKLSELVDDPQLAPHERAMIHAEFVRLSYSLRAIRSDASAQKKLEHQRRRQEMDEAMMSLLRNANLSPEAATALIRPVTEAAAAAAQVHSAVDPSGTQLPAAAPEPEAASPGPPEPTPPPSPTPASPPPQAPPRTPAPEPPPHDPYYRPPWMGLTTA